jgi:hypothetical protein
MDARDLNPDEVDIDALKRLYAVSARTPVFIAGSVRGAEADILMDIYIQLAAQIP